MFITLLIKMVRIMQEHTAHQFTIVQEGFTVQKKVEDLLEAIARQTCAMVTVQPYHSMNILQSMRGQTRENFTDKTLSHTGLITQTMSLMMFLVIHQILTYQTAASIDMVTEKQKNHTGLILLDVKLTILHQN